MSGISRVGQLDESIMSRKQIQVFLYNGPEDLGDHQHQRHTQESPRCHGKEMGNGRADGLKGMQATTTKEEGKEG